MNESTLKSTLVTKLRKRHPGWVVLRHEDRFTHGVPDISVTALNRTTWWEVKLARPTLKSEGIQDLNMLKLDGAGTARYIIYEERNGIKSVVIVRPRFIEEWRTSGICTPRFDHEWVISYITNLQMSV